MQKHRGCTDGERPIGSDKQDPSIFTFSYASVTLKGWGTVVTVMEGFLVPGTHEGQ